MSGSPATVQLMNTTTTKENEMPKYIVKFQEEIWYDIEVEAASEELARENFWLGEVDISEARETGREIQQDMLIELKGETK
jgi:hypothetical protein